MLLVTSISARPSPVIFLPLAYPWFSNLPSIYLPVQYDWIICMLMLPVSLCVPHVQNHLLKYHEWYGDQGYESLAVTTGLAHVINIPKVCMPLQSFLLHVYELFCMI